MGRTRLGFLLGCTVYIETKIPDKCNCIYVEYNFYCITNIYICTVYTRVDHSNLNLQTKI